MHKFTHKEHVVTWDSEILGREIFPTKHDAELEAIILREAGFENVRVTPCNIE